MIVLLHALVKSGVTPLGKTTSHIREIKIESKSREETSWAYLKDEGLTLFLRYVAITRHSRGQSALTGAAKKWSVSYSVSLVDM